MQSADSKRPIFVSAKTLGRFFQAAWWKHNWRFALAFLPIFKAPMILATLGGIIMVTCMAFLAPLKVTGTIDGNVLIPTLIGVMAGSIITGILLIVAMFIGLIRIAGFTRAFLRCPYNPAEETSAATIKTFIDEGLATVRSHKMQLSKSWLVGSIIMIPLIFVWCSASFMVAGLTPEMIKLYNLGPEVLTLRLGAFVTLGIVGLMLSNYSITLLAVSTMLDRSIKETSIESLWLAITTSPALSLVSIIVFAAVTAITTPYAVMVLIKPDLPATMTMTLNPLSYISELWQGISGVIVIPMSTAMLCEVVRNNVVISESGKIGADKN